MADFPSAVPDGSGLLGCLTGRDVMGLTPDAAQSDISHRDRSSRRPDRFMCSRD